MTPFELALVAEEVEASNLSESARRAVLDALDGYSLKIGRRQLRIVRYIETALAEGLTRSYAVETAADLHGVSARHAERLYDMKRAICVVVEMREAG